MTHSDYGAFNLKMWLAQGLRGCMFASLAIPFCDVGGACHSNGSLDMVWIRCNIT